MSKFVQVSAQKLPTMLGAGILSVSLVGLAAGLFGVTLTVAFEVTTAVVGMVLSSRYA